MYQPLEAVSGIYSEFECSYNMNESDIRGWVNLDITIDGERPFS